MFAKDSTPPAFEKSWTNKAENLRSTISSIVDKISGFVGVISAIRIETTAWISGGKNAKTCADNSGRKYAKINAKSCGFSEEKVFANCDGSASFKK